MSSAGSIYVDVLTTQVSITESYRNYRKTREMDTAPHGKENSPLPSCISGPSESHNSCISDPCKSHIPRPRSSSSPHHLVTNGQSCALRAKFPRKSRLEYDRIGAVVSQY